MIGPFRPSDSAIRAYVDRLKDAPFSYPEVHSLRAGKIPEGYVEDHNRVQLGRGERAWVAAREAIRSWGMFRLGWIELKPEGSAMEVGTIVCVVAKSFGLWTTNPAKVVDVIDESGPVDRFGFAYGTLAGHVAKGEERFLVEWDHSDDSVWYDIRAFSQPAKWYVKAAYPLARMAQKRFARDSKAEMARRVAAS